MSSSRGGSTTHAFTCGFCGDTHGAGTLGCYPYLRKDAASGLPTMRGVTGRQRGYRRTVTQPDGSTRREWRTRRNVWSRLVSLTCFVRAGFTRPQVGGPFRNGTREVAHQNSGPECRIGWPIGSNIANQEAPQAPLSAEEARQARIRERNPQAQPAPVATPQVSQPSLAPETQAQPASTMPQNRCQHLMSMSGRRCRLDADHDGEHITDSSEAPRCGRTLPYSSLRCMKERGHDNACVGERAQSVRAPETSPEEALAALSRGESTMERAQRIARQRRTGSSAAPNLLPGDVVIDGETVDPSAQRFRTLDLDDAPETQAPETEAPDPSILRFLSLDLD